MNIKPKIYLAVVGGGEAEKFILETAYEVGREIAPPEARC